MRLPVKSAIVTPRSVTRFPVLSNRTSSSNAIGPDWVAVATHSMQAWSPPTSSGWQTSVMSESASSRSSNSTASWAAEVIVRAGDHPCTSST